MLKLTVQSLVFYQLFMVGFRVLVISYWIDFFPLILLQLLYSDDFNVDAQVTGFSLFSSLA